MVLVVLLSCVLLTQQLFCSTGIDEGNPIFLLIVIIIHAFFNMRSTAVCSLQQGFNLFSTCIRFVKTSDIIITTELSAANLFLSSWTHMPVPARGPESLHADEFLEVCLG